MRKFLFISLVSLIQCTDPPPLTDPLKIAVLTTWPGYNVVFIAQEKGFFTKHGVEVTLVPRTDYSYSLQDYREGRVDGAFMVLSDAIICDAENIPTNLIYATDYSTTGDLIVGQPDLNSLQVKKS